MNRGINKVLFAAAIFNLLLFGCSSTAEKEKDEDVAKKSHIKKQAVKVTVKKVREGAFSRELMSNGKLLAKKKATVPFLVQEQIAVVKVKNGQRVQKGELLAQVEPFKYKKTLDDCRNQYEKARIDLDDRLLGYGFSLKDSAKVPANILKMVKIRSGFNQALSNQKEAERNFAHTMIKAPIGGVVANLEAKENNPSSLYKKCCEIINDGVLLVEFSVLEGEMSQVKRGQKVEVTPFANPNQSYKGIVTAINPTIDEHGMIRIEAEISNRNGKLLDGMNAKVLIKNRQPASIIIPKTAVLHRQNRKVVFVHEDGVAKWVYVETGEENSSEVTITDESLKPIQKPKTRGETQ